MLGLNRYGWIATVVIACVALSVPTEAHQQWLLPNFFSGSGEKAWLSFDHSFSDRRFHADSAPSLYYQWWVVGPDQKKISVPSLFAGKTKVVGELELAEQGTYRLEAEEANMVWTKLRVDGSEAWQPGPRKAFEGRDIVESKIYFAKALAYVTLGSTSTGAHGKTGDPLEIFFQQHPNELEAGRTFEIDVLSHGEPVAGQAIQWFSEQSEGHDPMLTCTTDTEGSCKITPESPGIYLLTSRLDGPLPDDPTLDGFSYRVSVVLDVAPSGK